MIKSNKVDSSNAIRNEISRFESVHPNIYAIYELLDQLDDTEVSESIKENIKEYVVSIEDSFVNSQEWTLPRFVNVLKLALVGSVESGKSALVHRYLTGTYIHDESPEGGRFKKEILLDGASCLLLIRDEGGCPDRQLAQWADGIVVVFSLASEQSLSTAADYYRHLAENLGGSGVPVLLVGTQDSICDSSPRLVEEATARRLAAGMGRAGYYETCATYGLNVDRVFMDVCSRILQTTAPIPQQQQQLQQLGRSSRPTTPQVLLSSGTPLPGYSSHSRENSGLVTTASVAPYSMTQPKRPSAGYHSGLSGGGHDPNNNGSFSSRSSGNNAAPNAAQYHHQEEPQPPPLPARPENLAPIRSTDHRSRMFTLNPTKYPADQQQQIIHQQQSQTGYVDYDSSAPSRPQLGSYLKSLPHPRAGHNPASQECSTPSTTGHVYSEYNMLMSSSMAPQAPANTSVATTTTSTTTIAAPVTAPLLATEAHPFDFSPSHQRASRPNSDKESTGNEKAVKTSVTGGNNLGGSSGNVIGSGRCIPIKQGYLYKKSSNQLNRERRTRKYVTLTEDGRLTYYANMNDYMNQVRGKDIDLQLTSIKLPGVPYRNSCLPMPSNSSLSGQALNQSGNNSSTHRSTDSTANPTSSTAPPPPPIVSDSMTAAYLADLGLAGHPVEVAKPDANAAGTKSKRHRRIKSSTKTGVTSTANGVGNDDNGDNADAYEFILVNREGNQWQFESGSVEERDEWVVQMEAVLLARLRLVDGGTTQTQSQQLATQTQQPGAGQSQQQGAGVRELVAGNQVCADCGAAQPDWASLSLGVCICIECGGIHRQLGSHLSKVRSLSLDEWSPMQLAVMHAIGNTLANSVWEAAYVDSGGPVRPQPGSPRAVKDAWVRAKYVEKRFLAPLPHREAPLQQQMVDAICRGDTRQLLLSLAYCSGGGAGPDGCVIDAPYSDRDSRTALHIAATLGNTVYLQLLIWAGADPVIADKHGRTAYFYAHYSGKAKAAEFLMRRAGGCHDDSNLGPHPVMMPTPSVSSSTLPPASRQPYNHQQQQQLTTDNNNYIHFTNPASQSTTSSSSNNNNNNNGLIDNQHSSRTQLQQY